VLGWPAAEFVVQSLGTAGTIQAGKILRVELLGSAEKLRWKQTPEGLRVTLPANYRPAVDFAASLKVMVG